MTQKFFMIFVQQKNQVHPKLPSYGKSGSRIRIKPPEMRHYHSTSGTGRSLSSPAGRGGPRQGPVPVRGGCLQGQ